MELLKSIMTVGLGEVAEETCTSGSGQAPAAVCVWCSVKEVPAGTWTPGIPRVGA